MHKTNTMKIYQDFCPPGSLKKKKSFLSVPSFDAQVATLWNVQQCKISKNKYGD